MSTYFGLEKWIFSLNLVKHSFSSLLDFSWEYIDKFDFDLVFTLRSKKLS